MAITDSTGASLQAGGYDQSATAGIQPFLDLLNNGVNAYQQIKLADVQAARIQAGLPELTSDQVSSITGNIPDASIYPAQQTNWLLWIAGAMVVYFVVLEAASVAED